MADPIALKLVLSNSLVGSWEVSTDTVVIVAAGIGDGDPAVRFTVADLLGRTGTCFRCDVPVESTIEVAFLDGEGRNDCPESGDGAPHEIDPPDGWDE